MSGRYPLRLVLMDGRLAGGGSDTLLVAARGREVRRVQLADTPKPRPRRQRSTFPRFCLIGALGFAIDAVALFALVERFAIGPVPARVLSLLIAVTATWLLHRRFTFRSTDPRRLAEWLRFLLVNGTGAAINFAVYVSVLVAFPGTPALLALVMGSAVALLANYWGARLVAFRTASPRRLASHG